MQKNEPTSDCPPPFQLPSNNINISPTNNNNIFEQNKISNFYQAGYQGFRNIYNNIDENLNISIGITFNELESLTKENLVQLLQFINYSCNFNLKNIKYIDYCCGIFEITENLNRNGYNIVITKSEYNELHSKLRNKNEDINENKINQENNEKFYNKINIENDDNFYLLKKFNEEKHNYYLPISCPDHNNIKFDSLSSYLIHCKEYHKIFTCKGCGKVFEDFNNFKFHIYKIFKNENENRNIDIENYGTPPLFKYLMESNILENNIKCSKCELVFDSIEKMSIHYYEVHEKQVNKNESFKDYNENKIEVNENREKIKKLNQKKEDNIKSEEVKKESTFEEEEGIEIIEEISKESPTKKEIKFLQRKKNHDKEVFINIEELKRKDNLKRQEELKRHEEIKIQDKMKGDKELKIQEKLKREEDLEGEEEIKNNGFHYVCCYDNKKFSTQKLYFDHFRKDHPSSCSICGKEFTSINALQSHYISKNKSHKIFSCKICGKSFLTINALNSHCKDKKH